MCLLGTIAGRNRRGLVLLRAGLASLWIRLARLRLLVAFGRIGQALDGVPYPLRTLRGGSQSFLTGLISFEACDLEAKPL